MSTDLSCTTHPLLAAAALRRVADLRALGVTYHLRRQRGQARPSAAKDRWKEQEGELARTVLLPALIRCVGNAILCDQLMEANHGIGNESEGGDGRRNADYQGVNVDDLSSMMDLQIGNKCPLRTDDADVDHFRKTRQLGPGSLLDVLYGLAKLSDMKRRNANAGDGSRDGSFRLLAALHMVR